MLNLLVPLDVQDLSPRELRQAFAQALRESIQRARRRGKLDTGQAEELWRVVPDPERI